jgi:hypothetical protein
VSVFLLTVKFHLNNYQPFISTREINIYSILLYFVNVRTPDVLIQIVNKMLSYINNLYYCNATVIHYQLKSFFMKMLQFSQLNPMQRKDAIDKMVKITTELNIEIPGVQGENSIVEAINEDLNPDADFIFDEIDETQVDVIYRENI